MDVGKLPEFPNLDQLREVEPDIKVVNQEIWYRVYQTAGQYPSKWSEFRYFGPLDSRFDHHELDRNGRAQARGVIYCASTIPACLAEAFQNNRAVDPNTDKPWLASFSIERRLNLLDLTGIFSLTAGASQAINSSFRQFARNWSRGFYEAYPEIEGLYYRTSMTGDVAITLYERIVQPDAKTIGRLLDNRPLNSPTLHIPLQEACVDIGYKALW